MLKMNAPPATTNERPCDRKHWQLIDKTWRNNSNSDYTETLKALSQSFRYEACCDRYWSDPEVSLLYGTPLYEAATETQRLALNHLYWLTLYQGVAATEVGAMLYNQITAGVFQAMGGYDTLCQELLLETAQEKQHIRAFHKICTKTRQALLGKTPIGSSHQAQSKRHFGADLAINVQSAALRLLAKGMLRNYASYYSPYLAELERKNQSIPVPTYGIAGQTGSEVLLRFFTINFGLSPFLASQSFSVRLLSNILVKAQEHCYSKYFLELDKRGETPPIPTSISRYHFLDESFHLAISQAIGVGMPQDFPPPSQYEKFVGNQIFHNVQKNLLSGLSGVLPSRFVPDTCNFMMFFYKILRSPIFAFSAEDALYWLERCFCNDHEGFQVTLKYHKRLLAEMRRIFSPLDYLQPANREFRVMVAGGSLERTLQRNQQTFQQFSRSLAVT